MKEVKAKRAPKATNGTQPPAKRVARVSKRSKTADEPTPSTTPAKKRTVKRTPRASKSATAATSATAPPTATTARTSPTKSAKRRPKTHLEVILPIRSSPQSSPGSSPDTPTPKSRRTPKVSISDQLLVKNTYSKGEYDRTPILKGRVGKAKAKPSKVDLRRVLQKAKGSPTLQRGSRLPRAGSHHGAAHNGTQGSPLQFLTAMANVVSKTLSKAMSSLLGSPKSIQNSNADPLDDNPFM